MGCNASCLDKPFFSFGSSSQPTIKNEDKEAKGDNTPTSATTATQPSSHNDKTIEPETKSEPEKNEEAKIEDLSKYVEGVMGEDVIKQTECTTKIRKISYNRIDDIVQSGTLPRFVEFLQKNEHPSLQLEAAWVLTNVAAGYATQAVVDVGALPHLIELLKSPNKDVCEQAMWAVGNIAGDSPTLRDIVLVAGAMTPVLEVLKSHPMLTLQRNASWVLSNLCRGKPQPSMDLVRPALPILSDLISNATDDEVLENACWSLSYLSDGSDESIQEVVDAGVCPRLVELLTHSSSSIQIPALRSVGNVVTGSSDQTQHIIDVKGSLSSILALFGNDKNVIRKEACWTASNILAGTDGQIQSAIDANFIPPLIQFMIMKESSYDVRKEAIWAIANATSGGTKEQVTYLLENGCVEGFIHTITLHDRTLRDVAWESLCSIVTKISEEDYGKDILTVEECDGLLRQYCGNNGPLSDMEPGLASYLLKKNDFESLFDDVN